MMPWKANKSKLYAPRRMAAGFSGKRAPTKGELQYAAAKAIQQAFRNKRVRSKANKAYKGNLRLKGYTTRSGGMYHRYK